MTTIFNNHLCIDGVWAEKGWGGGGKGQKYAPPVIGNWPDFISKDSK